MGDTERFNIIRPLGADAAGFVARDSSATPPRLVVLERVTRTGATRAPNRERVVQQCQNLVGFEHPKVVPVREVLQRDGEVLVVCDFVDGEWLSVLLSSDPRPSVEVLLRVMLDVLEGLAALHDRRDDQGQPLHLVHGALSPATVLVAEDGVAEIAAPFGTPLSKPDRFVAPELRRGDSNADVRADVYSAGAMLREVLGVAPSDAKWAEQLTDIAWRACSVDPDNRWPSVASMATTLKKTAGSRLASVDDVASYMHGICGARIRARRATLDLAEPTEEPPPSSGEPISVRPSDMMVIDPESAPTLIQRMESAPPPVPKSVAVAKVALVRKAVEVTELPEPAIERQVAIAAAAPKPPTGLPIGSTTMRGMAAIAPPGVELLAPQPMRPKAQSLPPPDIVVPDPPKKVSLPPPDIVVQEPAPKKKASLPPPDILVAPASTPELKNDAYRRKLPTFPTLEAPEKEAPPSSGMSGVTMMAIAAALVITFGLGWWVGRNHPPPSDVPVAVTPPTVPTVAAVTPTATATMTSAATATTAAAPTPSVAAVTTSTPAAITPVPVATAAPTTTTLPVVQPVATTTAVAVATAPKPTATWAPPPATATAAPKPVATATATATASPTATVAAPPRPAGSAGYVPSEL